MKITKRQLRRIIREERSAIPSEREISPEQAEAYLRSRADSYRRQGVTGKSMEMLLMDDFMDDLGHQHSPEDYEGYIRELVLGESKMKITKKQLRRIIKEEKAKVLAEQKVRRIVRTALLAEGVDGTITTEEDLMNTITGQEVRLEIMGGGQEVRVLGDGRGRAAAAYDIDGVMQDMLSAAGGDGNAVLRKLQSVAKRVSTDGRTDRSLNITPDLGPPDYSEHGVH